MPTDKCVVCEQPLTYKAKYPFHNKCFKGLSAPRRAELARRAALTLTDLEKIEGKKQAARTSIAVDVETKKRAAPPPAPPPAPRAAPRNISILHDAIDQVDQLREVEVLEQLIRQRKRELKRPPRYLIYREHELVNCGKSGCLKCGGQIPAHGPYWYVYLQDREAGGKLYKTYVGKNPDAWKDKLSKRGIEPFEDETVRFEGHNARYGDL